MKNFDYKQLDDIIHSKIRLGIMVALISADEAEFVFLKKTIGTTDGNLSVHLKKLEDAEYILSTKAFVDRKPLTTYKLTPKGRKAFKTYLEQMEKLVGE
jgi:DNA-binding MarR family transcriptional regulator